MLETLICLVVLLIMLVLAWRERQKQRMTPVNYGEPEADSEYWYYWFTDANKSQENVFVAAALTNYRNNGRHLGPTVTVKWKPGQDIEIDRNALYVERYGWNNGVIIVREGDAKPLIEVLSPPPPPRYQYPERPKKARH